MVVTWLWTNLHWKVEDSCCGLTPARNKTLKVRKLMNWDKDSLAAKPKAAHASRTFTMFLGQLGVQPSQGKQDSIVCNGDLGDKCHRSKHPFFFLLHPTLYPEHDVSWNGLSLCQLRPATSPLSFLCTAGRYKKQKSPWHCGSKHCFQTNPNHR